MTTHDTLDELPEGQRFRLWLQKDPNYQLLFSAMRDRPELFEHDPLTRDCKARAARRALRDYLTRRRDAAASKTAETPKAARADATVKKPPKWFADKTDGAEGVLDADVLRTARSRGRIKGEKRNGRWVYEVESVCLAYEQHRAALTG